MADRTLRKAGWFILAGVIALSIAFAMLPQERAKALTAEGGLIENLSVGVLACGVLLSVLKLLRKPSLVWAAISLMFIWMYLRELDYQKLFTPRSIESIGFYSNSKVPLQMKLAAALAMAPVGLAALYLLLTAIKAIKKSPLSTWVYPVAFAGFLLGISMVAEKLLPPRFQTVEEIGELGFVSFLAFLVAQRVLRWPSSGTNQVQNCSRAEIVT